MVRDPRHIRVIEGRNAIAASMIFKWFTGDFVSPLQVRGFGLEDISSRGNAAQ